MLASNVPGAIDELLSGIPDASGVMAKETETDTAKLVDYVRKAALDKNYSTCIVVPSDHIWASINLNRYKGIRAATCLSKEDMELAKENGANIIIIPKGSSGTASDALSGLFTDAAQQNMQPGVRSADKESVQQKSGADQRQQQKQEARQDARKESGSQQAYEGKGMLKKLKHSLGIEE